MRNYQEWEKTVPRAITGDALWQVRAYRLALFAADIGWQDVLKLARNRHMLGLSDQLYRALGSVSANIAEGYSRQSGRDGEDVVDHRLNLFTHIIRLLLTMIPQQRARTLREPGTSYHAEPATADPPPLESLLQHIPSA